MAVTDLQSLTCSASAVEGEVAGAVVGFEILGELEQLDGSFAIDGSVGGEPRHRVVDVLAEAAARRRGRRHPVRRGGRVDVLADHPFSTPAGMRGEMIVREVDT
jgi:hypothetical protein